MNFPAIWSSTLWCPLWEHLIEINKGSSKETESTVKNSCRQKCLNKSLHGTSQMITKTVPFSTSQAIQLNGTARFEFEKKSMETETST